MTARNPAELASQLVHAFGIPDDMAAVCERPFTACRYCDQSCGIC